ncbi:hypothetical protein ACFFGT_04825 [Mucilaginibacter angelicae]|uniref:Apea-like HEPN domain-containing protein n=1 Tax=Mucilaginibacter angelicae TaxID=869718 RepID=A0ABV6L1A1_9SPHI
MRIKVEADIQSDVYIDEMLEMKLHPFLIRIVPHEDGLISKIAFERPIVDYGPFLPQLTEIPGKGTALYFPEPDFIKDEKKLMQHIESFGGLDLGIKEISWDSPLITWIPENEEEASKVPVLSYRRQADYYGQAKKKISLNWLQGTLLHRKMLAHLVLPLSFYRKGCNLYHRFEYSEAFLQFYLMLEGLFGNGQTKNQLVKKAFQASPNLHYGIAHILDAMEKPDLSQHKTWLSNFLGSKGWGYDHEGIIKMLVEQRGVLSHYAIKSTRKQRNTFEDADYHSLGFIAMMIGHFSSIPLRLDPFRGKGI